jgi:uncharacterized protein
MTSTHDDATLPSAGTGTPPPQTSAEPAPQPQPQPDPAAPLARPLALVTGASSGIGLELARRLAEEGFDLVLAAEDDALEMVADGLRAGGAAVATVRTDLRRTEGVEQLWQAVTGDGRMLAVAALNAGVGVGGAFVDNDLLAEEAVVALNVLSTVRLAKHVVRHMSANGAGRVLVTSSVAATMPGPFQAVYSASKAFVHSFAEALQEELDGSGVTVTLLVPGPTETEFFHRAGMDDTAVAQSDKDDPAEVADRGVTALLSGERVVSGSATTSLQTVANRLLPESWKTKAHRRMSEPGSGEE